MKKKESKKLKLSRETLQVLTTSDTQKAMGGSGYPRCDVMGCTTDRGDCSSANPTE